MLRVRSNKARTPGSNWLRRLFSLGGGRDAEVNNVVRLDASQPARNILRSRSFLIEYLLAMSFVHRNISADIGSSGSLEYLL
jgi:hypothetical protein